MLRIFGIFASSDGSFYINNRKAKIRYQSNVVRALFDIASYFELPRKEK